MIQMFYRCLQGLGSHKRSCMGRERALREQGIFFTFTFTIEATMTSSHDDDYDFSKTGADASLTTPLKACDMQKGSFVVLGENKPCKVVECTIVKTGKHGHSKATFAALDIFTGRRYEGSMPAHNNVQAPIGMS
jgi:hypothetical protein